MFKRKREDPMESHRPLKIKKTKMEDVLLHISLLEQTILRLQQREQSLLQQVTVLLSREQQLRERLAFYESSWAPAQPSLVAH